MWVCGWSGRRSPGVAQTLVPGTQPVGIKAGKRGGYPRRPARCLIRTLALGFPISASQNLSDKQLRLRHTSDCAGPGGSISVSFFRARAASRAQMVAVRDALKMAMDEEMEKNQNVIVLGEEVRRD